MALKGTVARAGEERFVTDQASRAVPYTLALGRTLKARPSADTYREESGAVLSQDYTIIVITMLSNYVATCSRLKFTQESASTCLFRSWRARRALVLVLRRISGSIRRSSVDRAGGAAPRRVALRTRAASDRRAWAYSHEAATSAAVWRGGAVGRWTRRSPLEDAPLAPRRTGEPDGEPSALAPAVLRAMRQP